jgi:staphyloferrin B biosynthesis citrate synthase
MALADHGAVQRTFKRRFQARERLLGTFLKTATPHATEILGEVGFDFVVVDAEHAPFSRSDIDVMMLAARATGIASVVRVQSSDPAQLVSVLDCGAAGVLVPHVSSAEMLRQVVTSCRYAGGHRGFSNSPRAGRYGSLGFSDHIAEADQMISILAMIEDVAAIDHLDEIFTVEGLTGAFIGRGDLSSALGAPNTSDPRVAAIVRRITDAAERHAIPLIAHVGAADAPDVAELGNQGVTAFLVASDQGLMRQAAAQTRRTFDGS